MDATILSPDQIITMMVAGLIALNLLFILVSVILNKLFLLRLSASSIIASLTMTWFSLLIIAAMFSSPMTSPLAGGFAMVISVLIYSFYQYIFQPDSLNKLAQKELKKQELLKRDLEKKRLKEEMKAYKKMTDAEPSKKQRLAEAKQRLVELENEKKLIKASGRKQNKLDLFFKKKVQKVIEKQN